MLRSHRLLITLPIFLLILWYGGPHLIPWAANRLADKVHWEHAREIRQWADKYGTIQTPEQAAKTAQMLQYSQLYYRWDEHKAGSDSAKEELAAARKHTGTLLRQALKKYSRQDFGDDAEKWIQWAQANLKSPKP